MYYEMWFLRKFFVTDMTFKGFFSCACPNEDEMYIVWYVLNREIKNHLICLTMLSFLANVLLQCSHLKSVLTGYIELRYSYYKLSTLSN